ncbi:4649_t:CDS:2 [Entrophospora sp. SA101]|nr:4649_t:CDS:2 [Entrophospora sp. SA101]
MAGKTSLAQLLEKQLLTDCPDMRIIRISLLWMEDDDPNWKFSDHFSWLMRGTGWHQFVAECSHIETVLIVDENTFKDIQQYSRLYIVAFASYGYHGAYDYSPNSNDIMKVSPFQLSEHSTWGLKEIWFTSEEYNDYVTNFSRSKLNLSSQQDEDNLLNYIRQCTLCHPGLVTFILNHIFEGFISQIKQNGKRLTFSEIFKYLKSYNFYANLMGTRAALGLKNMDKDETYLCDTVLFNPTGIPIRLETVPNYGHLYKTNLLSIVASGPNYYDKFLDFAAPLLRVAYLQTRVGSTNHSTKAPETFRDFLKLTFVNMNPETLCRSLGVGSDDWAIELLRDSQNIKEHINRFQKGGKYDSIIDIAKEYVVINITQDKRHSSSFSGKNYIYIEFNQDFNKVVMNFPDGEKTEMSLGGSGILNVEMQI